MVGVSLGGFLGVVAALWWWRYGLKKKLKPAIVVILLSGLPLISLGREGTYESGDLSINAVKTMSFYQNLVEGNWLPRWAGELNATYGYPAHLFAYPLPYYLASGLHEIGFSFINSVKGVLVVGFLLSGVGMYKWLVEEVGEAEAAVAGALLYQFAPYHLVDMHFRVAIGEILALGVLPWCLWFLKKEYYLALAGGIMALMLSHQAVALLAIPLIVMEVLRQRKGWGIVAVIEGMLLSAWYWLPVLVEGRYTHHAELTNEVWFPEWFWYVISPWRWGFLFQGPQGQLSFILGYGQWFGVILATLAVIQNKLPGVRFWLIWFWIYFGLMQGWSKPGWELWPVLKQMQFAYRILSVLIFLSAVVGAYAMQRLSKKGRRWVIFLAVASTGLNWGNRRVIQEITDVELRKGMALATAAGEGLHAAIPKWVPIDDPWQKQIPASQIEVVAGEGKVWEEERREITHRYLIEAKTKLEMVERTLYFPGWQVRVDGELTEIDYEKTKYPGIITFQLQPGWHEVEVEFERTPVRKSAEMVSLMAGGLFGGWLFTLKRWGRES